jgi:hypothetical protein
MVAKSIMEKSDRAQWCMALIAVVAMVGRVLMPSGFANMVFQMGA